jgi:hypothetical protein
MLFVVEDNMFNLQAYRRVEGGKEKGEWGLGF